MQEKNRNKFYVKKNIEETLLLNLSYNPYLNEMIVTVIQLDSADGIGFRRGIELYPNQQFPALQLGGDEGFLRTQCGAEVKDLPARLSGADKHADVDDGADGSSRRVRHVYRHQRVG